MALAETLTVSEAFSQVMTMAGSAMEFIQGNPFLTICFAACIVPIAFRVISGARHSVGA